MVRLFTAINIPENIRSLVKKEVDLLSGQFSKFRFFRWVKEENWHFTLIFLGDQNEEDITKIKESIADLKFNPIEINLNKIIYGPSLKNPRMIWLSLDDESTRILGDIKDELEKKLENKIVFQKENRPFQGHLTLARFNITDRFTLPKLDIFVPESFLASQVSLVKSVLGKGGAAYEVLS